MESTISYERYQRQVILKNFGEAAQQKLERSRVLVVGAGGLGCPALQYLAAAGTGTIGIVDDDVVSLSDLHRQVLYSVADIGFNKAQRATATLQQLNPEIEIIAFAERLTVQNAFTIMHEFDVILDATDNFSSRYLINDACVLLNKPLVFGAVSQYEGQVAIFNCRTDEKESAVNYRDLFPHPPREDEVLNCAQAGVLGVLPGIIGTMQANETIKLVTGIGKPLISRLLTYNGLNNQLYELELSPGSETHSVLPRTREEFMNMDYEWLCAATGSHLEIDHHFFDDLLGVADIDVIDVRQPDELPAIKEFAHHRVPFDHLHRNIHLIKSGTVVIICQSGNRSLEAAKQLTAIFGESKKIYSLRGGIIGWKQHHAKHLL